MSPVLVFLVGLLFGIVMTITFLWNKIRWNNGLSEEEVARFTEFGENFSKEREIEFIKFAEEYWAKETAEFNEKYCEWAGLNDLPEDYDRDG